MPIKHRGKKRIPFRSALDGPDMTTNTAADIGPASAYLGDMLKEIGRPNVKPGQKPGALGAIALIVPLVAILAATGWYAARAWISVEGPPMPMTGYIAMTLGVVFSVVVGCGLMALLFYSNRHGYDEISYNDRTLVDDDRE
jgi:hypothetical protein